MVLPGSSIGRYLVKRKLAEGGMAELYLAAAKGPEGFEKEVVVKLIKAFLLSDQTFIEMFKQEARLASRLNHPNVVQIFDFDRHEDAWFIAMEYVHGASLWDLRRRCRELAVPFPATLVAEIGAQVARGLHYAHTLTEKGKPLALVHRDVTPHNVLLSYDGSVKLTDFGIAKAGTSFTAPGMLKGKFAYMSPEQARGERVDARTDVFAMGITLWEMLTGGRLFEGDSDIAVLRAVQESLIAPPSRLNSDVPQELSEVVLKALARPLDARFQSAQELERSLTNFVLKNAQSGDDTNVGLFLRQMFRDELEEAERAEFTGPGTNPSSQTPIIDTYALGNTVASARNAPDAHTQQTATPSVPGPVKTAQQPGLRISRPLSPLMDEDDGSAQRTDQMDELAPREKTAQQRVSVKRLPFVAAPEPAPTPMPLPAAAPEAPVETPAAEAPKSSLLPWILAACLAVGLVGGLSIAITRGPPAVQPPPSAIELPLVVKAPPLPPPLAPPTLPAPPPLPAPAPVAVVAEPKPAPVEPPPVRPPVPEPVAVKPEEPKPPQPTPSVEPAANPVPRGWLEVSARPFATLSIDGKPFGEITGVRRIQVPPGPHSLVFIHPRLKETKPVTVKAGQTTTVKFEWVPK